MRQRLKIILTLLLLSLSVLSCATSNLDFQRGARDTFVKIKQNVAITVCNPEDPKECLTKTSRSTGSGAVVMRTDEGSYVLTAGHVCSFEKEMQLASEFAGSKVLVQMRSVNLNLGEYVSDIISMDNTIDTCLLFARNLYTTKVAKIAPYSRSLEEGERVYNVAAPVGIFYKDVVPLLEGFFMGNRDTRAYYSIPAMGGSSGSPIVNIRGDLVGMIHSVNVAFPMISVSPTYSELKKFIKFNVDSHKKSKKENKQETTSIKPFWKFLGLDRI